MKHTMPEKKRELLLRVGTQAQMKIIFDFALANI
jgi:hypothetical protein